MGPRLTPGSHPFHPLNERTWCRGPRRVPKDWLACLLAVAKTTPAMTDAASTTVAARDGQPASPAAVSMARVTPATVACTPVCQVVYRTATPTGEYGHACSLRATRCWGWPKECLR